MSFGSDPGRDDGGLPPLNIEIPDDARELDRDVLAYRREQRAKRRRARLSRLLRVLGLGRRGFGGRGGHGAILPLIATCVALSMLAGAMLSLVTISPASAPTVSPSSGPQTAGGGTLGAPGASRTPGTSQPGTPSSDASAAALPAGLTSLPAGTFTVYGAAEPVATVRSAALALVPPGCACDLVLRRLAEQAGAARVGLYFVGESGAISQVPALTARDGMGVAAAAADTGNVFGAAYRPMGLTVLLVYSDATARVLRTLPADFYLGPSLRALTHPGRLPAAGTRYSPYDL